MWGICLILTIYDVFEVGHPARTDARIRVLEDAKWFYVPYPGQFGWPTVTVAGNSNNNSNNKSSDFKMIIKESLECWPVFWHVPLSQSATIQRWPKCAVHLRLHCMPSTVALALKVSEPFWPAYGALEMAPIHLARMSVPLELPRWLLDSN